MQEYDFLTQQPKVNRKIDFKATLQHVLTYTGAYKPIAERLVRHLNQELLNDKKLLYTLLTEQEMEEEWKRAQNAEKEAEDNKESLS
jgi:hypothetical protein